MRKIKLSFNIDKRGSNVFCYLHVEVYVVGHGPRNATQVLHLPHKFSTR